MSLLRLDNVSLAYGHVPLLANVDFQVERGERVCLVGRNGAGKTTILRVISGVALPDEGGIWRHGYVAYCTPRARGSPGYTTDPI